MKNSKLSYSDTLIETMNNINKRISIAGERLNYATDEDLIDSIIYEMKALQTQYSYYNKICRRLGVNVSAFDPTL